MSTQTLDAPSTMETTVLETNEARIVDLVNTNDPEQAAHIVLVPQDKRDKYTPQSWVMEARVFGTPIEALCGHTWVPSRDPEKLPLCQACEEIYRNDPFGHGDRGDLPNA